MSIESVHPIQNAFRSVEGAREENLFKRVWYAVGDFFTNLAEKIKAGANFVWNKLKSCCCSKPREPGIWELRGPRMQGARPVLPASEIDEADEAPADLGPMPDSLTAKLDPYRNMPLANGNFMLQSIQNIRPILQRIDHQLTQKLQQKLNVSPEVLTEMMADREAFIQQMEGIRPPISANELPYQLVTFNESLEAFDPGIFPAVLEASLRAYLFSENSSRTPSYFQHQGYVPGNNTSRRQVVNYENPLKNLKLIFQKLPHDKKEILIDSFNCDPEKLDLPPAGKKIIKSLRNFSSELHQNNQDFLDAYQEILPMLSNE